jgi:hypothetical protein
MIGVTRHPACVEIAATMAGMHGASWEMGGDCVKRGGICRSRGVGMGRGTKAQRRKGELGSRGQLMEYNGLGIRSRPPLFSVPLVPSCLSGYSPFCRSLKE